MPKRVKSHFHCLTVIGVERKMVSVLRRRKKYAVGTSSTPSNDPQVALYLRSTIFHRLNHLS